MSDLSSRKTVLDVRDLSVGFPTEAGVFEAVKKLSFSIEQGRTLCLVGESGSGKSVTAMALMRLTDFIGAKITSGKIAFCGPDAAPVDIVNCDQTAIANIRGNQMAMIFQEPMTALNPVKKIGYQIIEALMLHKGLSHRAAEQRAKELLEAVKVPEAGRRLDQYPHELSGGMRQRVVIAMGLSCNPGLLIADEPTTALDVSVQAEILALIKELQNDFNTAVLFITHDMGVVAEMADDVVVMRHGEKVEEASVEAIFNNPTHNYTKQLLASVPKLGGMKGKTAPAKFALLSDEDKPQEAKPKAQKPVLTEENLLQVENLTVRYPLKKGLMRRTYANVHAVEDISFKVKKGETLAIVGESGCGKSTLGRALLRLVQPNKGSVKLEGTEVLTTETEALRLLRRNMQMIFQDAGAALNPKTIAFNQVAEPLRNFWSLDEGALREKITDLFLRVGLSEEHLLRYPHELSGGQRQRLCIARAISVSPQLVVADESVSALDVSVQAQVLNLMLDLQADLGLSYVFISHDMAVVERISHRVAVMYAGRIVEIGSRAAVFENPQHDYTKRLLDAVPIPDPTKRKQHQSDYHPLPSPIHQEGYMPEQAIYAEVGEGHLVAQNF